MDSCGRGFCGKLRPIGGSSATDDAGGGDEHRTKKMG